MTELKLIGTCEGALVYSAVHIATVDCGQGVESLAATVRKYRKNAGETPAVIVTAEQLAAIQTELAFEVERHARESARAEAQGLPAPEPLPASPFQPMPAPEPAPAPEPEAKSEDKPKAEKKPKPSK